MNIVIQYFAVPWHALVSTFHHSTLYARVGFLHTNLYVLPILVWDIVASIMYNLTHLRKQTIKRFVLYFQANITRANHIMFTMGTDFKYQYANSWFRQLDKFIHYVNKVFFFWYYKENDLLRCNFFRYCYLEKNHFLHSFLLWLFLFIYYEMSWSNVSIH